MFQATVCFPLLVVLFVATSSAQPKPRKPDFTGTWKANFSRSRLQFHAPESTVFRIRHNEPRFRLSRTHVFQGQSDTWEVELTTDGKEVVREEPQRKLFLRLNWEGNTLVFRVRILQAGEEATDVVRYELTEGGKVFLARERYRSREHNYDNLWILEKQD